MSSISFGVVAPKLATQWYFERGHGHFHFQAVHPAEDRWWTGVQNLCPREISRSEGERGGVVKANFLKAVREAVV